MKNYFYTKNGFTLLEILVAMAILSVIGVMVFGAFNGTLRASAGIEERAEITHTARFIARKLGDDLAAANLLPNNDLAGGFLGEEHKVRNRRADEIRFTNIGRRTLFVTHGSDQVETAWYVAGGKSDELFTLVRSENPYVIGEEPQKEKARVDVVTNRLWSVKARYFTGGSWVDSFDSAAVKQLPKAVSVEFTLQDYEGNKITRKVVAAVGGVL